jgi:hypothetical protein
MSFFLAMLLSGLCFRCLRGCLKYGVIAGVLCFVAYKDPVLAQKVSQLSIEAWKALREWIVSQ